MMVNKCSSWFLNLHLCVGDFAYVRWYWLPIVGNYVVLDSFLITIGEYRISVLDFREEETRGRFPSLYYYGTLKAQYEYDGYCNGILLLKNCNVFGIAFFSEKNIQVG